MPWHSNKRGVRVHHFDVRCPDAEAIEPQHFRNGDGGLRPCPQCLALRRGAAGYGDGDRRAGRGA